MEANATYTDTQISTHALREEGDQRRRGRSRGVRRFLPTPSARRATLYSRVRQGLHRDFYPRPPRGGRPGFFPAKTPQKEFLPTPSARRATEPRAPTAGRMKISTHALREEGDEARCIRFSRPSRFLPTPSARRATANSLPGHCRGYISTHALREEGDPVDFPPAAEPGDFYPRPPRGGRHQI